MKHTVILRDGSSFDCDDFGKCNVRGLVCFYKEKSWREKKPKTMFQKEDTHVITDLIDFKYIPLSDIKEINVTE